MQNKLKKSQGFGLIGLIITLGIIALLIFGYRSMNGNSKKNQIETGQDAIDKAQEAADAQNQGSLYLQNEIQDSPPVNFHGVVDKARELK